jgi:hypothetical protein
MITLNLEKPEYETNKFFDYSMENKMYKLSFSSNKQYFLKENLKNIIDDISLYFVNHFDYFVILCNLLNLEGINLKIIDFYCHKYEKKWYISLCLSKYKVKYHYAPLLTCFIIGNKIDVLLKDKSIICTFLNLIFYKHLFEDGIYDKIINNLELITYDMNTPNFKRKNIKSSDGYTIISFTKDSKNIKIRGYYKTKEEAEKRCNKLNNIGENVYICENACIPANDKKPFPIVNLNLLNKGNDGIVMNNEASDSLLVDTLHQYLFQNKKFNKQNQIFNFKIIICSLLILFLGIISYYL